MGPSGEGSSVSRDENREGIPVLLALEDVGERPAGPPLEAINFHNTCAADRARLAAQLDGLGARFGPVDEAGLDALIDGRPLPHGRPGLLPVLYEAYRNHYDTALELIEREGLVAWLFVPSEFPGTPVAQQHAFAEAHEIGLAGNDPERVAMTWDELRDVVARGHVVACHTATHVGVADAQTPEATRRQLAASKATLEGELGITVSAFAWLWGTPVGVDAALDARLAGLGYRFVFSESMIQRLGRAR
jgi:Polysaccharide deacetylase